MGYVSLCIVTYADDLILIAESREDLQSQINWLGMYVDKIKMDTNEKKTNVLVFRKQSKTKDINSKPWYIGEMLTEETKSYKYLGA